MTDRVIEKNPSKLAPGEMELLNTYCAAALQGLAANPEFAKNIREAENPEDNIITLMAFELAYHMVLERRYQLTGDYG